MDDEEGVSKKRTNSQLRDPDEDKKKQKQKKGKEEVSAYFLDDDDDDDEGDDDDADNVNTKIDREFEVPKWLGLQDLPPPPTPPPIEKKKCEEEEEPIEDEEEEKYRLASMARFLNLNVDLQASLDRITWLVQRTFKSSMALITLVDEKCVWIKAQCLANQQYPPVPAEGETVEPFKAVGVSKYRSFCVASIRTDDVLVVPDALKDEYFKEEEYVIQEPFVRFYAGAPLKMSDGYRLGTLCVLDTNPKEGLSVEDQRSLRELAKMVVREFSNHLTVRYLLAMNKLEEEAMSPDLPLSNLLHDCLWYIYKEVNPHRTELLLYVPGVCRKCFGCQRCGGVAHVFKVCQAKGKAPYRPSPVFISDCSAWKTLQDEPKNTNSPHVTFIDEKENNHFQILDNPSSLHSEHRHHLVGTSNYNGNGNGNEDMKRRKLTTTKTETEGETTLPTCSSSEVLDSILLQEAGSRAFVSRRNSLNENNARVCEEGKESADHTTTSSLIEYSIDEPLSSASAAVLTSKGGKGVLRAVSYRPRKFSLLECGLISSVARLIVTVMDRALAEEELTEKNEQIQQLLQNVLPKTVIQQLQQTPFGATHLAPQSLVDKTAKKFDSVSILFADLVEFTRISAEMGATEMVSVLNDLFCIFDNLTEKHGLEKIKTIGDAYMVAGGLPIASEPKVHSRAIAEMALDMDAAVLEYNSSHPSLTPLSVRIGIHTGGSVVAGVIGLKKFSYDVWGDAVNLASRMETTGVPGRVHCTAAVEALLRDYYEFEPRGETFIKGKGSMQTFFLNGRQKRNPH